MLFYTKLSTNKFCRYSDLESLERNMTSRLDYKDIDYVISDYKDLTAKECDGILSNHDHTPAQEKLTRYAFPLKSSNNETIKR
jgi:hypothetical protein